MAFQRIDKKNPKIICDQELEGFSYKNSVGDKEVVRMSFTQGAVCLEYPNGHENNYILLNDIPKLVEALWAAYALAERRKLEKKEW